MAMLFAKVEDDVMKTKLAQNTEARNLQLKEFRLLMFLITETPYFYNLILNKTRLVESNI